MNRMFLAFGMLLSAACLTPWSNAQAQAFPDNKTVRLVVPQGPGGPTDLTARLLAEGLRTVWGSSVIVDNRAGAGGNIGADHVAKAQPDGYSLLFTNVGPMVSNQALFSNIGFNSETDFAPISLLVESPTLVYVRADLPVNSLAELVALAKKQPGKLNYADGGMGTIPHLGAELLKHLSKIDITRIGFRDGAQINAAIGSDQFDIYFTGIEFYQWVKNGKMKALAISARARHPFAPDVPTMTEAGLPGFTMSGWYGLLAPAKTPPALLAQLHKDSLRAVQAPEIKARLEGLGLVSTLSSPSELAQRIKTERAQWNEVVKAAGIKAN
jgi:tripartite-type tricarboxylate transporter receptor subunit TctC